MNFVLVNHATDPRLLPDALSQIAQALAIQIQRDYAARWGNPQLDLFSCSVASDESQAPADATIVGLFDDLGVAGALGYHDVTPQGRPCVRIGVKAVYDNGGTSFSGALSISVTISHEILETLRDRACNEWSDLPNSKYEDAHELCDRVEGDAYEIVLDNGMAISVSNFLTPKAFTNEPEGPYDHLGLLKSPWEIRPSGYALRRRGGPRGRVNAVFGATYPAHKREVKHLRPRAQKRGYKKPGWLAWLGF